MKNINNIKIEVPAKPTKDYYRYVNNYDNIKKASESDNLEEVKKAVELLKKALPLFEKGKTKNDKALMKFYMEGIVEYGLCKNTSLTSDLFNDIYSEFYTKQLEKANPRAYWVAYSLATNPNFPQYLKLRLLSDSKSDENRAFIISGLASNVNNSSELLEEIYNNHQCDYIEFRSGMGSSYINRNICKNENTSNELKLKIINELYDVVSEKSKEFDNMLAHKYYFNEIFGAIAENKTTSEEVYEALFNAKENFKEPMSYMGYVAKNTKNSAFLDKIIRSADSHFATQEVIRNKHISSETIDFVLDNKSAVSYDAKSSLCMNPALNKNQLIESLQYATSWGKELVKDYILEHPSFTKEAGEKLLNLYGSHPFYAERVLVVKEKLQELVEKKDTVGDGKDASFLNGFLEKYESSLESNIDTSEQKECVKNKKTNKQR